MFSMENTGLIFIVAAWVYQYMRMRYGNRTVRSAFVGLYIFGTGLIVVGGWNVSALTFAEGLNILAFIAALGVMLASQRR